MDPIQTCCICLEGLKVPIKTLPCLHSTCSGCLQEFFKKATKGQPLRCPMCRSPFEVPKEVGVSGLQGNAFAANLVNLGSSVGPGSQFNQEDFDPNNVICEGCEEKEAAEYCRDCSLFFCLGCKKVHTKPKLSAHHEFISVDDALKTRQDGTNLVQSTTAAQARIIRCQNHRQQEVNSYCEQCQLACCSECVVDFHAGHHVSRLSKVTQQFKGDITFLISKVKQYDAELSQAIKTLTETLTLVNVHSKITEKDVHQVFERLRTIIGEREAELYQEIEKERHQKEKQILLQKEELEFLLKGIRDSLCFSEKLVKTGSDSEIATSHRQVTARFETLMGERERHARHEASTDAIIIFEGGEKGLKAVKEVVKGMGAIVIREDVSTERSSVRRGSEYLTGDHYSFDVTLLDKKGEPVIPISFGHHAKKSATISPPYDVLIEGPSKYVKVVHSEGKREGSLSFSFTLTQPGEHLISVLFKGKHLQGSPLRVYSSDTHIGPYMRDYAAINDQAPVVWGVQGTREGEFSYPFSVACNSNGELLVADYANHRIQVLDRSGKLVFKFGSYGKTHGQFINPCGVAYDAKNSHIIVIESGNHRVQVFDAKGRFLRTFGGNGSQNGQFSSPWGVAVDPNTGNYYITDLSNNRIQVFNSNGHFLRKFGTKGDKPGQLSCPLGIGILSSGNLVISEYSGNRLQVFDPLGNLVRVLAAGQLKYPHHLFVDSADNVLVADHGGNQISVFNAANGSLVRTLGKGRLASPGGVCMDTEGRIFVGEAGGHQVSIF